MMPSLLVFLLALVAPFRGGSGSGSTSPSPSSSARCNDMHVFSPLPNSQIHAPCLWDIRLNIEPNRIPSSITEIVCREPDTPCRATNSASVCRQVRGKIPVAYLDEGRIVHRQNITTSLGCVCARTAHSIANIASPPREKRTIE